MYSIKKYFLKEKIRRAGSSKWSETPELRERSYFPKNCKAKISKKNAQAKIPATSVLCQKRGLQYASKPWKTGINVGNLKRFARSCKIDSPMILILDQLMAKYRICKEHTKEVMLKAPWLRKQFLSKKLQEALKEERLEEARRIKDILRHEAEKKQWLVIHRVTKRNKAGAVTRIEVLQPDGSIKVCTGKEECEEAIK